MVIQSRESNDKELEKTGLPAVSRGMRSPTCQAGGGRQEGTTHRGSNDGTDHTWAGTRAQRSEKEGKGLETLVRADYRKHSGPIKRKGPCFTKQEKNAIEYSPISFFLQPPFDKSWFFPQSMSWDMISEHQTQVHGLSVQEGLCHDTSCVSTKLVLATALRSIPKILSRTPLVEMEMCTEENRSPNIKLYPDWCAHLMCIRMAF